MPKEQKKYVGNPNWVAGNYNANSLPSLLANLEVGGYVSQVYEYDLAVDKMPAINKKQQSRRSSVRAAISRVANVRDLPDHRFDIEVGQFVTPSNKMFCVLIVKRVA